MRGHRLASSAGFAPVGAYNSSVHQTLNLSVTSAVSSALTAEEVYRLWSSVDCFVLTGGSGVAATTTSIPLTAKVSEYIEVALTETFIAGIVSSGTGVLYITQLK